MKKLIILLAVMFCSIFGKAQIRAVFFTDVPPLHTYYMYSQLDSMVHKFFDDSLAYMVIKRIPESYCPKTGTYNSWKFIDYAKCDTMRTISITYRDISYECTSEGLFGVTYDSTSIASLYHLGTFERLIKVAAHELGHTYGLPHCQNPNCLMFGGGVFDILALIDMETDFCGICKFKLKTWKNK